MLDRWDKQGFDDNDAPADDDDEEDDDKHLGLEYNAFYKI